MAVPKRRKSRARRDSRRAFHARPEKFSLSTCSRCHAPKRPHHVCGACGFYDGRDVLKLEEKQAKKADGART